MKRNLLIIVLCVVLLNGCYYQPKTRPNPDNSEIWICDKPYSELHWDDIGQYGTIVIDDKVYEIVFTTTAGPQMMVYTKEGKNEEKNSFNNDYLLFRGHTTYENETAIVKVEKDFKNIFNGELPTFNFKRYNKEEYSKNKEE